MTRIIFLKLIFVLIHNFSFGQTISVFENKLSENLSICDLISNYIDLNKDFKYTHFDSSFYSISSYDNNSKIFGLWTFAVRNDSLKQIGFTSLDLSITSDWFNKLYIEADSLIKLFTNKYGKPVKLTINKKNFFQKDRKYKPGDILKAMWITDGQKLKISFVIDGEHNDYHYLLSIKKFKDYYGNIKLPAWWDGY